MGSGDENEAEIISLLFTHIVLRIKTKKVNCFVELLLLPYFQTKRKKTGVDKNVTGMALDNIRY